ncbi:liver-expressed antimicrobial peptide 2 [Salmo salar]|uniref:Liver-expressed antimicrobial peptide 2 n=1 Tax=Salmo salar TaxID=8030 RepID=A0A1S3L257_SALSA|nr:liver-expressed antimicrobial peptide 2-like [Salmo salar]|eukprot:XP_013985003.1 PREDICTED: liver-expressed antimicrobial peptide 2-like [Salmo salar]
MHGQNYSKAMQGVFLVALILMHQVCASPIGSHDSRLSLQQGTKLLERRTRMTPLWRFMGTKPTGAYCRDHFECSTQICRRGRCARNGAVHS